MLEPNFSIHADPYMEWKDTRFCHDCINRIDGGHGCDLADNVMELSDEEAAAFVHNAILNNKCDLFVKNVE